MSSSSRPCLYQKLDLRPSTDNDIQHSDFSAEKRRQPKLSFPFGSGSSSFSPIMCRPSQAGSHSTNEERLNSSPVRGRTVLPRVKPFNQEFLPDKSR
ncbi:unnamed protein product [Timema podura]|uniref:Uncharacterized protein n=1 Tax=Timema podura TaxID=61482 RepID=A0ABN7P0T2_TIMPD|nr:unnamed protein product [Timema podura]